MSYDLQELRTSFKAAAIGLALSAGVLTGIALSDMDKKDALPTSVLPAAFALFTASQLFKSFRQIRQTNSVIFPTVALK